MKPLAKYLSMLIALCLGASATAQQPFPVISTVDASTIAGRPVALDPQGKLLPWPMPEDTGYSYSSYFLSQWTICGTSTTASGCLTTTAASILTALRLR